MSVRVQIRQIGYLLLRLDERPPTSDGDDQPFIPQDFERAADCAPRHPLSGRPEPKPLRPKGAPPSRRLVVFAIIMALALLIVAIVGITSHANTNPTGYLTCPAGQYWSDKYGMCWGW